MLALLPVLLFAADPKYGFYIVNNSTSPSHHWAVAHYGTDPHEHHAFYDLRRKRPIVTLNNFENYNQGDDHHYWFSADYAPNERWAAMSWGGDWNDGALDLVATNGAQIDLRRRMNADVARFCGEAVLKQPRYGFRSEHVKVTNTSITMDVDVLIPHSAVEGPEFNVRVMYPVRLSGRRLVVNGAKMTMLKNPTP